MTDSSPGQTWSGLVEDDKDRLAEFLLAVNYEISFVDGRRTRPETNVEPIFQRILQGSRGDLVRQALFRLSDQFARSAVAFDHQAAAGDHNFVGPRVAAVRRILESVDRVQAKKYLTAVFFVGIATAEADGAMLRSKTSRDESERLDAILYSLGLRMAGSEEVLLSWIQEGG